MSVDGGATVRRRYLRRAAITAGVLVLLALLLLASGHWVLGVVFGAAAVAATLVFVQMRTVR
jgi:hypothetical protein